MRRYPSNCCFGCMCCAQQTGVRHVIVEALLIYRLTQRASLILVVIGKPRSTDRLTCSDSSAAPA